MWSESVHEFRKNMSRYLADDTLEGLLNSRDFESFARTCKVNEWVILYEILVKCAYPILKDMANEVVSQKNKDIKDFYDGLRRD